MNITILSAIFPPEPVVGAQTASSLAKELALHHHVTVITSFPSRPGGKLYSGYKRRLYQKEQHPDGYEIVRCFSVPSQASTLFSRFRENIVFGVTASIFILFSPKPAVIHSNTWPIFASGLMSLVARLRHIPYILRVVDIYPESLVSQKRQSIQGFGIKFLRNIDRWIAAGAAHITVLTEFFKKTYREERGIPAEKISIIPDWVESDLDCVDDVQAAAIRSKFGIGEDAFVVAYGGNIGVAAGVETLIEACAESSDIHLLIAGDGSQLEFCRTLAEQKAPGKVTFFSPWPKEQTMALYQAADVLALPTRGEQSVASVPSKLIRYMLSGRPIIAAGLPGTELVNVIETAHCGRCVPPDDSAAMAAAIMQVKNATKAERLVYGSRGREYALEHLTVRAVLPRLIKIIQESVKEQM
jgi:colanic acid biosynthesis glycosyl transferase WcaI